VGTRKIGVSGTNSRANPLGFYHSDNLDLIHNQRKCTERDMNFPASNAVNDSCNVGFDFASVVRTREGRAVNFGRTAGGFVSRTLISAGGQG
jgi:hypothetical protein